MQVRKFLSGRVLQFDVRRQPRKTVRTVASPRIFHGVYQGLLALLYLYSCYLDGQSRRGGSEGNINRCCDGV